jgi:hypothetical protein
VRAFLIDRLDIQGTQINKHDLRPEELYFQQQHKKEALFAESLD